jgi:D-threo-aldose 1-dehydrogenase
MATGRFDASRARRSLEESLKRLGLDRVPLLHLHDPEHAASLAEITGRGGALPELMKMKEEGIVDAVGLAAGNVEVMMPLLRDWDFDALITHNRYTLVNRNAEPMIAFAASKGIAVLNAAPYASGVLAKGTGSYKRYVYQEASAEALAPVKRIEAICAKHDVPPGAVALQFSLRDPRITSTICGVSRPERVQETLDWAARPIPDALWEELKSFPFATDDPEATRDYKPA